MDQFLGQIMMFGGNFAPRGWAFCSGQLLPISQYTALFSLLGTTYGGDGRTTFGLPDLRGRAPISVGHGPGLSNIAWGQKGGVEQVTLNVTQMPSHNHSGVVEATEPVPRGGAVDTPAGNYVAQGGTYSATKNSKMASDSVSVGLTGGNQPHPNRPPFLGVYYIIALIGIFPSRS